MYQRKKIKGITKKDEEINGQQRGRIRCVRKKKKTNDFFALVTCYGWSLNEGLWRRAPIKDKTTHTSRLSAGDTNRFGAVASVVLTW